MLRWFIDFIEAVHQFRQIFDSCYIHRTYQILAQSSYFKDGKYFLV